MELTETLENQIKRARDAGASQDEREAVIDLLVMTMYADRFIDQAEHNAIERVAKQINGDQSLPMAQYLYTSFAKVRNTIDEREKQHALLEDISARLATNRMRKLAYQASRAVAQADDEMASEEEQFLSSVRAVFEIRPEA